MQGTDSGIVLRVSGDNRCADSYVDWGADHPVGQHPPANSCIYEASLGSSFAIADYSHSIRINMWISDSSTDSWLQLNLDHEVVVMGVLTSASGRYDDGHTTKFHLWLSESTSCSRSPAYDNFEKVKCAASSCAGSSDDEFIGATELAVVPVYLLNPKAARAVRFQ